MSKIARVSPRQISSAQALVKLRGGLDKVDPYIRKVATAKPLPRAAAPAAEDKRL